MLFRSLAGARDFGRSRSRVAAIGSALGDWTAAVAADENDQQRRLRLAACELSDSAWREHPAFRAREAFYRLAQYPFIGLDHAARAFLAYAVFIRYEGSPDDLFIRPIVALLPAVNSGNKGFIPLIHVARLVESAIRAA